jgi:phosphoglycolate phosphatase
MSSSAFPAVDALIFDLDGTLWDTCESCALAWNEVLTRHAIEFRTIVANDVRAVAGRPHDQCIRDTFVGLDEQQLQLLSSETALADNDMIERFGGVLYPGVPEGLDALARSHPLYIVSNCQVGYIELFLRFSGLAGLFRDFECWGNTGRPKADNLRSVIDRNRLAHPWFIGDAAGDEDAARINGVPFVHAAYGFGQCQEAVLRLREFQDLPRTLHGRG